MLLLSVLDLVVIGVLGATIWRQYRLSDAAPTPSFAPCVELTLQHLPARLSPTVYWTTKNLTVRLTARYEVPHPPPGSAQLLWVALDALPPVRRHGCPLPDEVVIVVTAQGTQATLGHVARLKGSDVAAWSEGRLQEEQLVERATYRLSPEKPPGSPPDPARYLP
ncbi:MAG: hypothetical protein ACP5HM_14810 [Anaerolineae bacterium]